MKFQNTSAEYQSSVTTGKKMGFAPEAESFLMDMMSDGLYSDKYGSIVRELASNAFDANVEGGRADEPVRIDITKPNSFTNQGELVITDCGVGICPDRVNDIFTLYFASTKRDDNEMIGGFGIGAKSPFAYTNVFRVETWCNGKKYTYLMEKRGQDRTCTLLDTVEEEGQGTKIRIPVKDNYDYEKFVAAVNGQCLLMRPLAVTITDGEYKHADVVEFDTFYVARSHDGALVHNKVALGNVVYDIDPAEFLEGAKYITRFSVIPKLEIGKVMPTMSRESLQITDDAREYLRERFAIATAELQGLVDDSTVETDFILEAFKDGSADKFVLPGTDIELELKFGGYSTDIIKKESNKLAGFTGNRNTLRSYLQTVVRTTAQYTQKYSGTGMTWRGAAKSDSHRYQTWVVNNNSRNWSDQKPLFIRWKPEDKLTPADKEYMEEKFAKTDYTSMHLIQRAPVSEFSVTHYAPLVGGIRHEEGKEGVAARCFEKYGRRILKELMDKTESFEDWRATPEYIAERKAKLKALRTAVTKKDRAKDQFRLRGIGRFGVVDTTLENLQGRIGYGILYLNNLQLQALKDEHAQGDCRWQDFDTWVHENYEINNVRLFVVSAKTYKVFQQLGVFSSFEEAQAKRAARVETNDATRFFTRLSMMRSQVGFDSFIDIHCAGDKAFNRYMKQVTKLETRARKMYAANTQVPVEQTEFKIGQDTISLAPLARMVKTYLDMQENQPFLADSIAGMRNWAPAYQKKCVEALKYVYPGRA
jgi:hypothetical protein